jgi:hypothetical protein
MNLKQFEFEAVEKHAGVSVYVKVMETLADSGVERCSRRCCVQIIPHSAISLLPL